MKSMNRKNVQKLMDKYPNAFNYVRIVEWPFELRGQANPFVLSFNHYGYAWADGGDRLPEEMTTPIHEWMDQQGWPALETGKYACRFSQTYKEVKKVLKKIERHILNPFWKVEQKIEETIENLNELYLEKIAIAGDTEKVEWAKAILLTKDIEALKAHPVRFNPAVRDIPFIMRLEHQLMMLERRKG